uniref:Uncharacterized protein n=1 Tax=Tetranychus urticae TaxID=32264 RepID=T1L3R7_TETUR
MFTDCQLDKEKDKKALNQHQKLSFNGYNRLDKFEKQLNIIQIR